MPLRPRACSDRIPDTRDRTRSLLAHPSLEPALNRSGVPTQVPERRLDPLLVVVVGPTASGKTSLSLAMAVCFDGEIVICDSVAMYREFEVGTAKPAAAQRLR